MRNAFRISDDPAPGNASNGADDGAEPWSFTVEARLRAALAAIPTDEKVITEKLGDSHAVFYKIGMAIERLGWGERGYGVLRDWCSQSNKFDEKGLRTQWRSFQRNHERANPVTLGTVFHTPNNSDGPLPSNTARTPRAKSLANGTRARSMIMPSRHAAGCSAMSFAEAL